MRDVTHGLDDTRPYKPHPDTFSERRSGAVFRVFRLKTILSERPDTSLLSGHHFVFSHFHRFCTFLRCSGKTRFLRLNLALLRASHHDREGQMLTRPKTVGRSPCFLPPSSSEELRWPLRPTGRRLSSAPALAVLLELSMRDSASWVR